MRMEKRAREFLDISAKYYNEFKGKWTSLLHHIGLSFDDDIYNDTIIRVYDKLMNEEDLDKTEDEVIAYWCKAFINNVKRDKKYSRNRKVEDVDVIELLKTKECEVEGYHLYHITIKYLLEVIKREFADDYFQLFKFYYLTNFTIEDISEVVDYNVKQRIMKMKNYLRDNVKQDND